MKILLFGSIAAGKTSYAMEILKKYNMFDYIAIDNFRRIYGDSSMLKEKLSQNMFLNSIQINKNQIIEASGLGKLGNSIFEKLKESTEKILVVIFFIKESLIYERLKNREWNIPFPGSQNQLGNIVSSINQGIYNGEIDKMWNKKKNISIFQFKHECSKNKKLILKIIGNYINNLL